MKTNLLLIICLFLFAENIFGQEKISEAKINPISQFVFDDFTVAEECDKDGNVLENSTKTMPVNAIFKIVGKKENDLYIIKFLRWKLSKTNLENNLNYYYRVTDQKKQINSNVTRLNLITGKFSDETSEQKRVNKSSAENNVEVTEKYFLIKKDQLILNGSVYNVTPKYEFVFGTITYLARIRPSVKDTPCNWSTDLNLGIAYGLKRNFNKNWGIAALAGLSVSKIKIDSLSTNPSINKSIEKVSLSPTLNILANYKKFFLGLGIGFDWINLDTEESKRWIYNKKPFYAIGLGINLFSANNSDIPVATNK